MEERRRRGRRRVEVHPTRRAERVAHHGGRRRRRRREVLMVVREVVRGSAATAGGGRVTCGGRRRQGGQRLVSLQAVVVVTALAAQIGRVTRGRRRGTRRVMVVRLVDAGVREHGRRVLAVVVVVRRRDHGVAVRVLARPVFGLVRRRAGRAGRVQAEQLLDGERRPLRQRGRRHARRDAARRGQEPAEQTGRRHVNVTVRVLQEIHHSTLRLTLLLNRTVSVFLLRFASTDSTKRPTL